MSLVPALSDLIGESETRPADFRARFARRARGAGQAVPGHRRRNRTFAAGALVAMALPAFASPGSWERFSIGSAGAETLQVEPMPFEQPGSSFPGSAFYYLEADKFVLGDHATRHEDFAGNPNVLDPGPAARPLHVLDVPFVDTATDRRRALQCLTTAIYYEAASEPDAGQRAVAQVVLNRVAHPTYPNTVCGVVYEGAERSTGCQFSFTCDGSLARKPQKYFWERAQAVAREALSGGVYAPVGLATHYHTLQVHPYWAPSLKALTTIGAHRFYSFHGPAGSPRTFHFAYAGGEPALSGKNDAHLAAVSAQDAAAQTDPVAIQNAYAQINATLHPKLSAANAKPEPNEPATQNAPAADQSSGSLPDSLPARSQVRDEYRNSGRWLKQP